MTPRINSRVPHPTNLDPDVLVQVHDLIRHGCHACQLVDGILRPEILGPAPVGHVCPHPAPRPSWRDAFAALALFPPGTSTNVPEGLLCFKCRSPQMFCRARHASNPYDQRPCLYSVLQPPADLHPGSTSLWSDLVIFLLSRYPSEASAFVLAHATSAGHQPPPAWSQEVPPLLLPPDFHQWFAHTGPNMRPPFHVVKVTNGGCLVVYLFCLHFGISL